MPLTKEKLARFKMIFFQILFQETRIVFVLSTCISIILLRLKIKILSICWLFDQFRKQKDIALDWAI